MCKSLHNSKLPSQGFGPSKATWLLVFWLNPEILNNYAFDFSTIHDLFNIFGHCEFCNSQLLKSVSKTFYSASASFNSAET